MSENLELTSTEDNPTTDPESPVTAAQIAEVIQEFEQYRERLIHDMTAAAQKAKLSKSKLMSNLEPELAQIDATLDHLRTQYAALSTPPN